MITHSHPVLRTALFAFGVVLVVVSPVAGLLPGPGGIFVFAAGLAFMLKNSLWARRRWARLKRDWPRVGAITDRVMRRPSARRRRERDRGGAGAEDRDGSLD